MKPPTGSVKLAQTILNRKARPQLKVDGVFGPISQEEAASQIVWKFKGSPNPDRWVAAIIQTEAAEKGFDSGSYDAFYGPQTDATARLMMGEKIDRPDEKPSTSGEVRCWNPTTTQMVTKYGNVGTSQTRAEMPFPLRLDWDLGTKITGFLCHKLVKDEVESIFMDILRAYGVVRIQALGIDRFGGCLNVRKKRGGSSWSMHCLPAGSPVWTPSGPVPIENLEVGDSVLSYQDGKVTTKPVKTTFHNGTKRTVRVLLNGGELECTPQHKVLVLRKDTVTKAEKSRLCLPTTAKCHYYTEMVEAGKLTKGDKVVVLNGGSEAVGASDDAGWFEVLGMFTGDGCIHHRGGAPAYAGFCINRDDQVRAYAELLLAKYFHVSLGEKSITINRLEDWRKLLPYNKTAREKTVPQEVWGATRDCQLAYLRGYIYTDGCYRLSRSSGGGKLGRIQFKAGSKVLIQGLKQLASMLGLRVTKTSEISPEEKIISGVKTASKAMWTFCATDVKGDLSFPGDPVYSGKMLEDHKNHNRGTSRCMGYDMVSPDFTLKTVKGIGPGRTTEVFDIEVEDTHNFITDGVVVSNSWGASIDLYPSMNVMGWNHTRSVFAKDEYKPMRDIFRNHGWMSLGECFDFDWQHFQKNP